MEENDLQPYLEIINKLRDEPFSLQTNTRLEQHPYILAATSGQLTLAQRRAFALEQMVIQASDTVSFSALAKSPDSSETPDLFQFLAEGEKYAAKLLIEHARSLGIDVSAEFPFESAGYTLTPKGQAYPSLWARLALNKQYGSGAAACAVNFPAWGGMWATFLKALSSHEAYGYVDNPDAKEQLAFIEFFANPIENLDTMAARIMKREVTRYEDWVDYVRLLQEYEVYFWDAIYEAN